MVALWLQLNVKNQLLRFRGLGTSMDPSLKLHMAPHGRYTWVDPRAVDQFELSPPKTLPKR